MDANNNPAPIDHPLPPYVHQPSTGEDDDFPNYDDNNYGDEYNNLPTIECTPLLIKKKSRHLMRCSLPWASKSNHP